MKQECFNGERYYYWSYSSSYGWTTSGKLSGYETLEELEKDNEFDMKRHKYKILKSSIIAGDAE